jgi:hypothetical protein
MKLFLQVQFKTNLDLFTFYEVPSAIEIPSEVWFQALCASLKMKHSLLLLETNFSDFPVWDESRRWVASDNYFWLSPRSLSVIQAAYMKNDMDFQQFKSFLLSSK